MTLLSVPCFESPQNPGRKLYNLEINTLEGSFSLLFGFWVFNIHTGHFSFFSLQQAKILGVRRREGRGKEAREDRSKKGKKGRREKKEGRKEGGKGIIASKKKKRKRISMKQQEELCL